MPHRFIRMKYNVLIGIEKSLFYAELNDPEENHYENMPIQIYRKFLLQKFKIFRYKNCDIFHISARNIDCGYSLEPPRRGGSNEYPQSMF